LKCNNTEEFKCHDTGSCIARKEFCNGHDDCREGSDEIHCGTRLFHYCQFDCFSTSTVTNTTISSAHVMFLAVIFVTSSLGLWFTA